MPKLFGKLLGKGSEFWLSIGAGVFEVPQLRSLPKTKGVGARKKGKAGW